MFSMNRKLYSKPHNSRVAIIDYGMGNLFNVQRACAKVGLQSIITSDRGEIANASGIILPGVGAFGDAMKNLKKLGLTDALKEQIALNKPFLGICLGMQLLLSESREFGAHKGLDIIRGQVVKFGGHGSNDKAVKVPQVGWNRIFHNETHPVCQAGDSPLSNVANAEFMYFVHSYYAIPDNSDFIFTYTCYENTRYCSSFLKGSIFAVQFHPEKSAAAGLRIFKNWAKIVESHEGIVCR